MTLAETNDRTRRALINRDIFGGSPAPPPGSVLARSSRINVLNAARLQEIMGMLKDFPDGFAGGACDDDDHTSGAFHSHALDIIWQLRPIASDPSGEARLLIVSTAQEGFPDD